MCVCRVTVLVLQFLHLPPSICEEHKRAYHQRQVGSSISLLGAWRVQPKWRGIKGVSIVGDCSTCRLVFCDCSRSIGFGEGNRDVAVR